MGVALNVALAEIVLTSGRELTLRANDLPSLYRSVDAQSARGQKLFLILSVVALGVAVASALLGAFTVKRGDLDWSALIAAVAFVLALLANLLVLQMKPERQWYDGRAAAESVKSLAWQYATGGGAFGQRIASPDTLFVTRLRDVLKGLRGLAPVPADAGAQITPAMRNLREAPLAQRWAVYRRDRLEDQSGWYRSKARFNRRRFVAWSLLALVMNGFGFVGALARGLGWVDVDLLGVFGAAAASSAAWLRTKDFGDLAEAYSVAAQDIELVLADLPEPNEEEQWSRMVASSEAAISREHVRWVARRRTRADFPPEE